MFDKLFYRGGSAKEAQVCDVEALIHSPRVLISLQKHGQAEEAVHIKEARPEQALNLVEQNQGVTATEGHVASRNERRRSSRLGTFLNRRSTSEDGDHHAERQMEPSSSSQPSMSTSERIHKLWSESLRKAKKHPDDTHRE